MIRFLIDTTVSKRDISGNCYHYSIVTSTSTGQSVTIRAGWGSDGGNIKAALHKAGIEWEEMRYTERTLPIRQWNKCEPEEGMLECALTEERILELEIQP